MTGGKGAVLLLLVVTAAACRPTYKVRLNRPAPAASGSASTAAPAARPERAPDGAPPAPSAARAFRLVPAAVVDEPGSIRIGIATERERIRVGGFDESWRLRGASGEFVVRGPVEASVRPGAPQAATWRLQVGTFADRAGAEAQAKSAEQKLGLRAVAGEAGLSGAMPVLVGEFGSRDEAAAAKDRVASAGFPGAFPVVSTALPSGAGFDVEDASGNHWSVDARELELLPEKGLAAFDGSTYRGALRFRLGTRGKLHLVNVLPLEEYLRGVVPAEMGPKQFPEPEALKAQAVAARSYAVRRRRESDPEGYDLCSTPRCQAYKGASVEDPATDRAIAETAGLVLMFDGKVADTLFTSTCGGRTDDVAAVFPDRTEPYLASVPCSLEGSALPPIAGAAGSGTTLAAARGAAFARWLETRGVRVAGELTPQLVLEAGNRVRSALSGEPMPGRPRGVARSVLAPVLVAMFRLEEAARILDRPDERNRIVDGEADELQGRTVELLRRFDLDAAPVVGSGPMPLADWLAVAGALAELTGLVEKIEGRVLAEPTAGWMLKLAAGTEWIPTAGATQWALYAKRDERLEGAARIEPFPGDRFVGWADGPSLLSLVVERSDAGGAADRDSSWSQWTRRFRKSYLLSKIRERRPIPDLVGFEVLERSKTGRIVKLRLDTGAEPVVLRGLDVRFHLDLPESLAAIVPAAPQQGEPTWLFLGRGWGHGVGLCQYGAYGLAIAGDDFRAILARYYPGTVLQKER